MKTAAKKHPTMSAYQITEILRGKHSKDVFVSECKDGSTWFGGHSRMDCWVMNRSWAHLCFTGYEIKISRGDFKQDTKWHEYLPLCNQLYFVCPRGMIEPEEVPDGVGLRYATERKVLTIKKAAHRDVIPPMELFCYILMCRTRVVEPNYHAPETREKKIERFKKWIADKSENKRFGDIFRYEISKQIDSIVVKNAELKKENERLRSIGELARAAGIGHWDSEERMRQKIANLQQLIPVEYLEKLEAINSATSDLIEKLNPARLH